MATYTPTNVRTYDLQFGKALKKLESGMAEVLKKTAKETLVNIVQTENPPYKTGSYMASHRVGINDSDKSDHVSDKKIPLGVAKQESLNEVKKLDSVKEGDDIYISNSVGYSTKYGYSWARNVEYAGWKGRGPYLVYEKAIAKIPSEVKKSISEVRTTLE